MRDSRAAASTLLAEDAALNNGTTEGVEINARVVVETSVLRGNKSVDEVWRELGIVDHHAVLAIVVPSTH